jgi:tetratricopeptide (TPR) repeat protein
MSLQFKHFRFLAAALFVLSMSVISCNNEPNTTQQSSEIPMDPYIDSLTQEINRTPEKAVLYAQRGEAFYELGSYDASINDLTKAIELNPENPNFYSILANSYLDYYQSKKALETMRTAAERFATDVPTLLKLSEFQMILNEHGAAIQTANSILEVSPMNPEAFYMMGVNYKLIGDTSKAINALQTAVEQDPDLLDGYYELGLLWQNNGNGKLGLQYFNNALEINPNHVPTLYAKGMYYTNRKMDNEAIEIFKQISLIDREYADPYFNVGVIFLVYDSLKQAYSNFNIAAEVEPTMTKAFYYRALTAEKMGDKENAIQDYQNARNLDKEDEYLERIEKRLMELRK